MLPTIFVFGVKFYIFGFGYPGWDNLFEELSPKRSSHFSNKVLRAPYTATARYARRVGRPRREWTSDFMAEAVRLFGSTQRVQELARQTNAWKAAVRSKLRP